MTEAFLKAKVCPIMIIPTIDSTEDLLSVSDFDVSGSRCPVSWFTGIHSL